MMNHVASVPSPTPADPKTNPRGGDALPPWKPWYTGREPEDTASAAYGARLGHIVLREPHRDQPFRASPARA